MAIFVPAGFVAAGLLPWLAGAVSGMFFALMSFFSKYLMKRIAVVMAVLGVIVALTTAFFVAIQAVVAVVAPSVPPGISTALGWFLPSQTPTLMGVLFACRILRWTYEWHVKVVQWKLY